MMPDIFHQLHKRIFKGHVFDWCMRIAKAIEVDARFQCQISHPGVQYFKNGVSHISQWSGNEPKEIQKVFGCLLVGAVQQDVIRATYAVLDFIYYAQYQSHTTQTLTALEDTVRQFHAHKDIFVKLGLRVNFEIPKIHSMLHYADMI